MASPRVVGEKEVTFNHLAVFNNPEQDNDLVGQSESPPKVRISSKCKWFIGIALLVAVALGFLTVGLLVTFSYKKRETKELIVDGVNVKIEEVRNQKWSRFQTSTTGVMYKTTVGD